MPESRSPVITLDGSSQVERLTELRDRSGPIGQAHPLPGYALGADRRVPGRGDIG